jgi:hypothetical protein
MIILPYDLLAAGQLNKNQIKTTIKIVGIVKDEFKSPTKAGADEGWRLSSIP